MNREEWLQARYGGIGASEAAAALGLSRWTTPLQLWAEKTHRAEPRAETLPMRIGKMLEPTVVALYEAETGRRCRRLKPDSEGYDMVWSTRPGTGWLFCTPDRVVAPNPDTEAGKPEGLLECKTTGARFGQEWESEPPVEVQVQGQLQMVCTGHPWVSYGVLIGGQEFGWLDTEPNPAFVDAALAGLERFWWHVKNDKEPPVLDERDNAALAALYPRDTGATVTLPTEALSLDARRLEIEAARKALEEEHGEITARLKAMIGDARIGLLPDGSGRYSWATVSRKEYVVPANEFRQFRRLAK